VTEGGPHDEGDDKTDAGKGSAGQDRTGVTVGARQKLTQHHHPPVTRRKRDSEPATSMASRRA